MHSFLRNLIFILLLATCSLDNPKVVCDNPSNTQGTNPSGIQLTVCMEF